MNTADKVADRTPSAVRVWTWPLCGYWRADQFTGTHTHYKDNGPAETHRLVKTQYVFWGARAMSGAYEGDITTVILWHGRYRMDGLEIRDRPSAGFPGLKNVRLEGTVSRWFLVADAVRYQP